MLDEFLAYLILLITLVAILVDFICMNRVVSRAKTNVKYSLLMQYFCLKLVYLLTSIGAVLLSKSFNVISPTLTNCEIEFYTSDFAESSSSFILFLIWLYLLYERHLIGCTLSATNIVYRNFRNIVILCFYVFNSILTIVAFFKEKDMFMEYKIMTSCERNNSSVRKVFNFHQIPTAALMLVFVTFFWRLFGGTQDPILNADEQTSEMRLVKFIKLTSLIDIAEVVFTIGFGVFSEPEWISFIRLVEVLLILSTYVLFLYYESCLDFLIEKLSWRKRTQLNRPLSDSRVLILQNDQV